MTLHFYTIKTWLSSSAGKMMSGLREEKEIVQVFTGRGWPGWQ